MNDLSIEQTELYFYVTNNSNTYKNIVLPTILSLEKFHKKGNYIKENALKSIKRMINSCSNDYKASHGYGFSLNDRIVMKISFKRKQLIYAVSKTVDFL